MDHKALIRNYQASLCPIKKEVQNLRILGSLGRLEMQKTSDMDIWIITSINTVEELAKLSNKELSIRKKLSKKLQLKNIHRHRASIFSKKEAEIYMNTFPVRVGNPYILKEQIELISKQNIDYTPIDGHSIFPDLIVSLEEFLEYFNNTINIPPQDNKWAHRIVKEIYYYSRCQRVDKDRIILEITKNYSKPKNILKLINSYLEKLKKTTNNYEVEKRRVLHKLMWTLEKVRWELVESHGNIKYFNLWRQGKQKKYGFFPREIGQLVLDATKLLVIPKSTKKLGTDLIKITRKQRVLSIEDFHNSLTRWIIDTSSPDKTLKNIMYSITFPRELAKQKVITRLAKHKATRFVKTEHAYYKLADNKCIVNYTDSNKISQIDIMDFGGKSISTSKLPIRQYVSLMASVHAHKTAKFGRLGDKTNFDNYFDYLLFRINNSKAPTEHQKLLINIVKKHSTLLLIQDPVMCHMDPGPRNLISDDNNNLRLIDWEHTSGCVKEWDLERIISQLPPKQALEFETLYLKLTKCNNLTRAITKTVMLTLFTANLDEKDKTLENQYNNYMNKAFNLLSDHPNPPKLLRTHIYTQGS